MSKFVPRKSKQSIISANILKDPSKHIPLLIEDKTKSGFNTFHIRDVSDITIDKIPIGQYCSYIKLDLKYVGGGIISGVNMDKKYLQLQPMNNKNITFSVQFANVMYLFVKKQQDEAKPITTVESVITTVKPVVVVEEIKKEKVPVEKIPDVDVVAPKKRRGRPRKAPIENPEPKKPRGRPRKAPIENPEPKKPRGRPTKTIFSKNIVDKLISSIFNCKKTTTIANKKSKLDNVIKEYEDDYVSCKIEFVKK